MPDQMTITPVCRSAQIFIGAKGDTRAAHVSHPGQPTPADIVHIDERLIHDIVKRSTGCACLSGTIDAIWEKNFDQVMHVQLGGR